MKVSYNYWSLIRGTPMEPARVVAQDYISKGNTSSSAEQLIQNGDAAINGLNTTIRCSGLWAIDLLHGKHPRRRGRNDQERDRQGFQGHCRIVVAIAATQLAVDLSTRTRQGRASRPLSICIRPRHQLGRALQFLHRLFLRGLLLCLFAVAVHRIHARHLVEEAQSHPGDTVEACSTPITATSPPSTSATGTTFSSMPTGAWQNDHGSKEGMDYAVKKVATP
jgi:hypothetical protein